MLYIIIEFTCHLYMNFDNIWIDRKSIGYRNNKNIYFII